MTIGHVGDSRAYLVRDGELEQLTEDHSLVNELLKSGKLSREEAEIHPQRSVITRAVGTDPDVDVDTFTVEAEEGDVFLLCSDGLTDMVADDDILEVVEKHRDDLDRAAKALVAAANRGGGEDNITVVAFSIAAGRRRHRAHADAPVATRTRSSALPLPTVDTMVVPPRDVEDAFVEPGSAAAEAVAQRSRSTPGARIRLVLTMLALLGDRRSAARLGAGALSLTNRNRELLYLVVVGASHRRSASRRSTSRDKSQISGASLTYAVFFFALYLAAHVVARYTVPYADPYVLPIAALLTAIGLTEIYRLGPKDAFRQGYVGRDRRRGRSRSRCSGCAATTGCSRTTSTSSGSARSRCSSCRCCP